MATFWRNRSTTSTTTTTAVIPIEITPISKRVFGEEDFGPAAYDDMYVWH